MKQMTHRLSLILIVAVIVSACGTPPEGGDSGWDWCYTHHFGDEVYRDFIDGNPDAYAQWVAGVGGGYITINGDMSIPPVGPATLFDVYPERVDVFVFRPDGVLGDIPVHAAVNIYGWNIIVDATLPAGFDFNFDPIWFARTYNPSDETSNSISGEIRTYVEGDGQTSPYKDIGIDILKVYGNGASPFIDNECADETPTPVASNTNAPTPTAVPACWGAEWDFRETRRGFTGTAWQVNSGFTSALTTSPSLSQRSLSLEAALDPTSPEVRIIRVGYYAELGFGAGDIALSLDGIEVESAPIETGLNYLVFDIAPLLVSFDEIAVTGVVGESPSAADPGGYLRVSSIEIFGIGAPAPYENLLVPTYFSMNCPPAIVATSTITPTSTPTPTGTPSACFQMTYNFLTSAYNDSAGANVWTSGVGIQHQNYHPNNFEWSRRLSARWGANYVYAISVSRVEIDISNYVAGDNEQPFMLDFYTAAVPSVKNTILTTSGRTGTIIYSNASPLTTAAIGIVSYPGLDNTFPASADPGGSVTITAMRVYGTGTPNSSQWQGNIVSLPCWDITPTPTLAPTNTPTPGSPTPTKTPTLTPTRTPIPTLITPTPTRTPLVVSSPTIGPSRTSTTPPTVTFTPTPTPTPSPTSTASPTRTLIPIPTSGAGTPTPAETYTVPIFGTMPPDPAFATLVGTVPPDFTPFLTGIPLPSYKSDVYNYVATAAAGINQLPGDITSQVPNISPNMTLFAQYAKGITSGVSLQEILGRKLYPIGVHAFYAIAVVFTMSVIYGIVYLVIAVIKFVLWIVGWIVKIVGMFLGAA